MATRHRATMGSQPTLPHFVNALGFTLAVIVAMPPEEQRQMLDVLTVSLTMTALSMTVQFEPEAVL